VIDLADKIKISSNDFQKATSELRRIESLLNEHWNLLSLKYSTMTESWRGLAGAAFEGCARQVLEDFAFHIAGISQLALDIEQAGQFMKEADQSIAQAVTTA
jgi:uncharacterized protein YukE